MVRGDDEGRGLLKQDRLEDKDADDRRDEDDMRNSEGFDDIGNGDSGDVDENAGDVDEGAGYVDGDAGDVDEDAGDVDDRFSGSTSSTAFSY